MTDPPIETRCGTVAIVGEPNAGKSTLLNALVHQPLAIVSRRPQTTRQPVLGIHTEGNVQIIFADQPGLLEARYLLHSAMRHAAELSLSTANAVLHVIPADRRVVPLKKLLDEIPLPRCPIATVRTKIDLLKGKAVEREGELLVSAETGEGLAEVIGWCADRMPRAVFQHDPDNISTQPVRFFAAEYIREAAFEFLEEELPYAVAVEIDEFRDGSDPLYIGGTILVERESQKRMVIGNKGRMIRRLGMRARERIEELVEQRVYLNLWVKVLPKWRSRPAALARFGLPIRENRTS